MKKIDLVFRTVGERTSEIALELAQHHIQPQKTHLIEKIRPFSKAVETMLQIEYDCDCVVFMDADCIILEDMRPFLDRNPYLYVDCFVLDRFRGQIHQGVHITHIDLVRSMQQVPIPQNDEKYVLRPESRIRSLALKSTQGYKHFKHFRIFHDFFQSYEDIFAKLCLRELRSRTPENYTQLEAARLHWQKYPDEIDFYIANLAVEFTRSLVPPEVSPDKLSHYIEQLPCFAKTEIAKLNLPVQLPLTFSEIEAKVKQQWQWQLSPKFSQKSTYRDAETGNLGTESKPKIFGIGLSRTGTKSLTSALQILGFETIHYPDDESTLRELVEGNYQFSLLNQFDGITDITVAAFYPQLDRLFPKSKFILTLRNKENWLRSLQKHWNGRPAFADEEGNPNSNKTHMEIRRLLRAATYGCYEFNADRLSYVYDFHHQSVLRYFHDRPESLLVLDICSGEGWEKLCPFLGKSLIHFPFPFVKKQSALQTFLPEQPPH